MSWYRRWRQTGGIVSFTLITYGRRRMLTAECARPLLRRALEQTRRERAFEPIAMVLLPDHLHCVWQLPTGDDDYSTRWRLVKSRFTRSVLSAGVALPPVSASRQRQRERAVWQRRFIEHQIRDDRDLQRHMDYIHFNPVKHGHVRAPVDWPCSTFRRFVDAGEYENTWGRVEPDSIRNWLPAGDG